MPLSGYATSSVIILGVDELCLFSIWGHNSIANWDSIRRGDEHAKEMIGSYGRGVLSVL